MKRYAWITLIVVTLIVVGLVASSTLLGKKTTKNTNNQNNSSVSPQDQSTTAKNQVDITNFAFNPNSLAIKVGDTVVFKNSDSVAHTVTADNKEFDMRVNPNSSVSVTFDKAGPIKYHCTIHPSMTGTVVVQ